MRPYMALLAGGTAAGGLYLALGATADAGAILAGGVACLTAAGFVLNDILDLSKDMANPRKPLATGTVTVREAYVLLATLVTMALLLLARVGLAPVLLGCAQLATLTAYSTIKARSAPAANAVTGLLCASCLLYGWVVGQATFAFWWAPTLLALLVTTSRELAKDMLDQAPDQIAGLRTFPVIAGRRATSVLLLLLNTLAVAAALTYAWTSCRPALPGMSLMAGVLLAPACALALSPFSGRRLSCVLLSNAIAMPIGLLTLVLTAR
jgi:4-hydroxybenzoate polyprenyltransferase